MEDILLSRLTTRDVGDITTSPTFWSPPYFHVFPLRKLERRQHLSILAAGTFFYVINYFQFCIIYSTIQPYKVYDPSGRLAGAYFYNLPNCR